MNLFKLFGEIAIKNDEANRAIDETAAKAEGGSKRTSSAFEKIGGAAKKIGTGIMAVGSTVGGATRAGTLLGGGEAGKEAIAPIDVLQGYVRDAVQSETEGMARVLIDQFSLLLDYLKENMPHDVVLDSGAMVGVLTPGIDARMADGLMHARRGNTR